MKHVLFRRILVSYLIIAPVLLVALELYLSNVIKESYISKLRENLLIQSTLIAGQLPSRKANLDSFCKKFKEKTGARVTIIDAAGRVIGDSDEQSEKMENHSERPEIKEALVNNTGSVIRFSTTVKTNLFYFAAALDNNPDKGFIRLAVPLVDLEKAISKMRTRIALSSIAALIIAVLIGIFQTRRITKSIEEIAQFSREIRSGNFRAGLFLREKGEMGELAENINDMAYGLKTMLERSREEKYRMEEVLRNMHDGFMLVDIKGSMLICNAAARKFFGIESGAENKPLMEAVRSAELTDIFNESIVKEKTIVREMEVSFPKELYLMSTAAPFYFPPESGDIAGIMLSFHDITRLKKLEDVRKDFVANVSHEIKTPITAIKGFAETLLDGALDDRENAMKFLQAIKNHSERLNSLVEDLLTLSRIELGDIRIEKTRLRLDDVVDTVFTTLAEKARAKNLCLKKDIPENLNEIKADRNRLIQILLNLVDNAIKFTEKGEVAIKVKSEKLEVKSEENLIEISVEDTGVGIPKKHLTRLGERFYRIDRSRSRELGGTGLGLAIVKHLVKANGWEMKMESQEGKGTKVRILLT